MAASLPGSTKAENLANPSAGQFVIMDPLSGPKGSALGGRTISGYDANRMPVYVADATNLSTGGLSTGIGIGANRVITANGIFSSGYDDNIIPGQKPTYAAPPPKATVATNTPDSTMMYIGGGRMIANPATDDRGIPFIPSPFTAGIAILGAGQGGSRDAGAGPVFTGFEVKMVTAAGAVATGAVVETGYVNRSGVALTTGQSIFGSASAASAAPTMQETPPPAPQPA